MNCQVDVLFFSLLRDLVGEERVALRFASPISGAELLDRLEVAYPRLAAYRPVTRLAVNLEYVDLDTLLSDGDEVALITPVSGG